MHRASFPAVALAVAMTGCVVAPSGDAQTQAVTSLGEETGDDAEDTGDDEGDATERLDVADGEGMTGGDSESGCDKVDFLFVIDGSGSMKEEQQQLIASFPGFIGAIEQSVAVDDFHIMVVDTDSSFEIDQCAGICPNNPEDTCIACADDEACTQVKCAEWPLPATCDNTIGAGRTTTPIGDTCGVVGDQRFLSTGQPDLDGTFACVASVGTGSSSERPMQAMVDGLGPLQASGKCNDGFLRDDAILVVTVISDEDDSADDDGIASPGDPAAWRAALVDAKHGDDEALVFLGLLGDTDLDDAICQDGDPPEASPAPRMRELAESLPRGSWSSVCVDDYSPFFEDAISIIDTACDEFVPPG